MKCTACQAEVPATARFCPSCATPMLSDEDVKSPTEVSLGWLKRILETQSYEVEVGQEDSNLLMARHKTGPNLLLVLRKDLSIITIRSLWTLKKPSWGQKTEFWAAVNKANTVNWLCTCYAPGYCQVFCVKFS